MTQQKTQGRPSQFARWWPWAAAVLSGVLLALSFPPADIGGLAFVALVPLLAAVWIPQRGKRRWLRWLGLGYVTGLVFFTMSFYWLSELAPLFHSRALNSLPLLLASELSLSPAVWALLAGWIAGTHFRPVPPPDPLVPFERPVLLQSSRNLGIAIFCAAAWVALEWVRGWLIFSGFGWNALGVAMHRDLPLIQIAEFTGVGGVSFLLAMCNAIALITVLRVRAEIGRIRLRPHFDFALTVGMVALAFGHGVHVLVRPQPAPADAVALKVAAVQPNISQQCKFDIGCWPQIFERMQSLSDLVALTAPDLLLWPEASVPGGMLSDADTYAFVRERAAQVPAMILGTDDLNRGAAGEDHNSAAFIQAGEKEPQFYDKQQLVPFGEYLPLRPLLGGMFGDLVPGDFKPGTGPGIFALKHPALKLAPLICFEDTRGDITRAQVKLGAHLLVNLTNDGWFGHTAELDQHMNDAVFRCIENRRPMVRCTNNGITASVDSFGRVDRWLEPFTQGAATRQMMILRTPPETFYTRYGEVFSIGCAAFAGLAIVVIAALRMANRRP
ncbi:MAG: apolipoprotein N-acyltransferase [Chthoniobacteraceae bacterium]